MRNDNYKYGKNEGPRKIAKILLMYGIVFSLLLMPMGMVHGATTAISLSKYSGSPGTNIWINGTGFSANSNVDIYWDNSYQDTTTTDANGNFSYQYTIPSSTAGAHTIYVTDGSNSASATFTVVPAITLSTNNGYVGTTVTVNGEGFSGNVRVYLFWDSTYLGRTTTNNNGEFTFTFNTPASPYGLHSVKAIDTDNNQATVSFLILSHITLYSSSGYYGKQIYYNCTGYSATARLSIIWDYGTTDTIILDTVTTDSTGSYSGAFRVPEATYGTHNVTGIDEYSHSDTTAFFVTPKVEIYPGSGIVGSKVYVIGYGFSGNTIVNISWSSGAILNSTTSNQLGSFYANITIPYATAGNHLITANDTNSVESSAVFNVVPNIKISPNCGLPGDTGIVTATGFSGSANIDVYWDFGLSTETVLSTGTTNTTGTYTASVTIPSGSNTTHTIAGVDANNYIAQTYYYLGPHIYISPNSGFVGTNVMINGTSFSPNTSVTIYWDGTIITTTNTNTTGYFSTIFSVPHSVYGYHTVTAVDANGSSASANYRVLAHIIISKNSGYVFDNITVQGNGFSGDSAVYIYWDSVDTQRSMLTNSVGDFTLTFQIPEGTAGIHTIYGEDTNDIKSDIRDFQIYPMARLIPNYGEIGTSYKIYCYGFGSSVTLNMLWDGVSESYYSTTNSIGSGVINAIVPNSTAGPHTIVVYDSLLNKAAPVNFTVIPPDTPIAYAPEGYVNSTTVTLHWSSVNNTASYTIEYSTSQNFTNPIIVNSTTNSYTLTGLYDGTTYYWRVQAVDINGNAGDYSNVMSFTIDATPPVSTAHVNEKYSSSTHILVYYNASDSGSGVGKVELYYSYNNSEFQEYSVTNIASGVFDFYAMHGDGNYSFYTIAYDNAGNVQRSHTICSVVVDTTPPTSYLSSLPKYTQSHTINLHFNASDVGTGVSYVEIYWSTDGSAWNFYGSFNTSSVVFLAPHDGVYYFKSVAVDAAGNVQMNESVIVSTTVDTTPPVSNIFISGTLRANGWYVSPAHISLKATDITTGVREIYYSINGGNYVEFNNPIILSTDGVYNISYYAVDFAGNSETPNHIVVKVDRTAPSLAIMTPTHKEVLTGEATIMVKANDTYMLGVYYRIDNGPWTPITNTGSVWKSIFNTETYSDGEHVIHVMAIDDAGNHKYSNVTVIIDNKNPSIVNISIPKGIVSGSISVSVEVNDYIGVKSVICKLSTNGFNKTYTMYRTSSGIYAVLLNTTELRDGSYTITITAENYGGKTTVVTSQFTVDNTPPEVKYTGSNVLSGIATLTFNVKDDTTGVKSAWISIDNGNWINVPVKNGLIKYRWNTILQDNGVHKVRVKIMDNAGNEETFEKDVTVNNLNLMPIVYTVILIVLMIGILFLLRKDKKQEKPNKEEPKKEKTEDMSLPESNENPNREDNVDLSDLEVGGDLNV